ncbi:MAG TPA: sodium:solute symporter [Candidatus Paceibacterota bacterium]|nr:sodium:solute symporter [Verrucomicrobiota bacterium]HRZ44548.1 sodium:solute symporter [Candidatus Paceibacterota bacterium]HRZ92422.1 sodium:solute symporter [Candidatus Paceibacterota bacterium]
MFPILAAAEPAKAGLFTGLDWIIIAAYFGILLGITWWSIRRSKDTADDYFLAGRHLTWWIIGASIFASNIGSEHLVGLAGSGCTDGVAMAHYELHAWCLLVLAWVLVPFYMRSMVYTMPEFLEKRFSATARWVLSVISLVTYVLTKIAVGIFAGGVVFGVLLPEMKLDLGFATLNSFWIGSVAVVVLTGLYTVAGGMRAVAYTEALQTLVLVFGSILLTVFGLIKLGGWGELRNVLGSEMFNLWKPLIPQGVEGTWAPVKEAGRMAWYFNGNYPWLGMLFCAPIIGLWYWCTDQYIVQRALGAPNEQQARRGTIFAAFLKLLPVFIFIIPGMICFALAISGKVPAFQGLAVQEGGKWVANREECQAAFPLMVAHVLPSGLRGIVVAGLLAALMSSLAGVFNASSTLFTMDFYQKLRPRASQHQLVWMGRIATTVMVLIGLLWIPVIQGAKGLYHYLQSVQGYLAPPIFVVFFLGVFMKRLNARGCLAALIVGFGLGMFRLAVDTPVMLPLAGYENGYTAGSFWWIVNNIYFQYFSLLIFVVCIAVMVGVSYLSPVPEEARIKGLTFATTTDEQRAQSRSSWTGRDVLASAAVLVLILLAYLYFRG